MDKHNKEIEKTISLHDTIIEEINTFCYLGNNIVPNKKYTAKIKIMALAKQTIFKKQNRFMNTHISTRTL